MIVSIEKKYRGALLGAAIGDAYGWPNEQNSKNINYNRTYNGEKFINWKRKCGGRYWPHEEMIGEGQYSDDTQLLIATLRCLIKGKQWNTFFMKAELPAWLSYERGGGGATKRAAECWKKGYSPWENRTNSQKEIYQYFMAGGNGVAMRILPHVFCNEKNTDLIMRQVVLNGMYTHGHPRALIGAMLYAAAVQYILLKENTLEYGELLHHLLDTPRNWSVIPEVNNLSNWIISADHSLDTDYMQLWNNIVKETIELLTIAQEGINLGVLDIGNETLEKLGCFDKKVNGAGNNTSVISIYLFSKFADNPIRGIIEAGSLKNADTDTIASMAGGLFGALYGDDWIPIEWRLLQDFDVFEKLVNILINHKDYMLNGEKQYPLFGKEIVNKMKIGDSVELLPFGRVTLCEVRDEKCFVKDMYATTSILMTEYQQTLYVRKLGKIEPVMSIKSSACEKKVLFSINALSRINNELKKVISTEDFLNVVDGIVGELETNNMTLSMVFIDNYKKQWKKYKITKMQIEKVGTIIKQEAVY